MLIRDNIQRVHPVESLKEGSESAFNRVKVCNSKISCLSGRLDR